jgi:hypothetical protein
MKRIIILAVVLFAAVTFNAEAKRHYHGVGGYFYTELSPYGSWIEVDYGVVVWRPTIIRVNWMPYQMGSWVWTYDGWYWDSYEPFGFITYHYGRWYYDDYYGWLWYPDYEWAPAWVEWRFDNNYIGWAPLHPYATFSISIGIFWSNTYYSPYHHWNYVTYNYFCDPYVYNYYVEPGYKYRIHSGTKYRHDYGYRNGRVQNRGIDVNYISTRSGQKIKQRDIIRTNDSRELKRDGYGKRDEIRTLDLKRDELVRNDLGRMEIKRENRRTSLDVEKVQIGKRENVSERRTDKKSNDRSVDIRTNDQNRKDIKSGVDKIFEKKRTDSNRNSDVNTNRTRENVDKRINETVRTDKRVDTNQRKNENITRNEERVIDQNKTKTNERKELNGQTQQQKKEVKRENTRVNSNDKVKRSEVKVEKGNNEQQNRSNETRVKTDRTIEKDNSREKNRR